MKREINFYFFELQGFTSAVSVVLEHPEASVSQQEFIQQTAEQTPHVKTPTNTAFKTKLIQSFQQFQFSHFINNFLYLFFIKLILLNLIYL